MEEFETEQIDKLYLELSQFTKATTAREIALRDALQAAEKKCAALQMIAHEAIQQICPVPDDKPSPLLTAREALLNIYRGGGLPG